MGEEIIVAIIDNNVTIIMGTKREELMSKTIKTEKCCTNVFLVQKPSGPEVAAGAKTALVVVAVDGGGRGEHMSDHQSTLSCAVQPQMPKQV